jgi:hypothetical protein
MGRVARRALVIAAGLASPCIAQSRAALPPIDTCQPGPYVVQFARNQLQIAASDRERMKWVVANYKGCPGAAIWIVGATIAGEAPEAQRQRATMLTDQFIAAGVDARKIRLSFQPVAFDKTDGGVVPNFKIWFGNIG